MIMLRIVLGIFVLISSEISAQRAEERGGLDCRITDNGVDYRGKISTTKSHKTCNYWTFYLNRVTGDKSIIEENYCRNPDGSNSPWCFVYSGNSVRKEDCDIPACKPYMQCMPRNVGDYVGSLSMTKNGRMCQRWDTQAPHTHRYRSGSSFPGDASISHANNFCRNPNRDSGGLWCYTTDPHVEREYCDVPTCKECKSSHQGREYSGDTSRTTGYKTCQRWDSQYPHKHDKNNDVLFPDRSVSAANNYCRNPDGEQKGPWCYTTDPNVRWQLCNIPNCNGEDSPRMAKAKHVVHIGIDGLSAKCMSSHSGSRSNMLTRIRDQGAYTMKGVTSSITLSGPGWSTMLCSLNHTFTGIKNNKWRPGWQNNYVQYPPKSGNGWPLPCIFQTLKAQDPSVKTAAFYDWKFLAHFFNEGIPGTVDEQKYCAPAFSFFYESSGPCVSSNAAKYIQQLPKTAKKSYTFVYAGNVDSMGHFLGWCKGLYPRAVSQADSQVGEVLDAIEASGSKDDFMVILATDHGGKDSDHVAKNEDVTNVPILIRGPGISHKKLPSGQVGNIDLAPTIADALGLNRNGFWQGRVISELYGPSTGIVQPTPPTYNNNPLPNNPPPNNPPPPPNNNANNNRGSYTTNIAGPTTNAPNNNRRPKNNGGGHGGHTNPPNNDNTRPTNNVGGQTTFPPWWQGK